jgi:hypothetical protein
LKVAVISSRKDLGTVPQFLGSPGAYARLLGREIASYYLGPLLVVMPNGFGFYDGGRSVADKQRVLRGQRVGGRSAVELTATATAAVTRLKQGSTLRSKDVLRPSPILMFTRVQPGRTASLRYAIYEDGKWVAETVTVFAGERELRVVRKSFRQLVYADSQTITWTPPVPLPSGPLRFCVAARDPTGNHKTNCLAIGTE